jgi:hypothetical protein
MLASFDILDYGDGITEQRMEAATALGASNAEPARATLLTARESAGIDRTQPACRW